MTAKEWLSVIMQTDDVPKGKGLEKLIEKYGDMRVEENINRPLQEYLAEPCKLPVEAQLAICGFHDFMKKTNRGI